MVALLIKFSSNGEVEWQNAYSGPSWTRVFSVQQISNGDYIAAGGTLYHPHPDYNTEFLVFRLHPDGRIKWAYMYPGVGGDVAYSVDETKDNGFVVAGLTGTLDPDFKDIWVLKLSSTGESQWGMILGGTDYESEWDNETERIGVFETSDGGYLKKNAGCG